MRLLEIATGGNLRVDEDQHVIRGVRIIGPDSRNGRKYPRETIRNALKFYEGKAVNADHPDRSDPDAERSVASRIGWLENVRLAGDGGAVGNLHYLEANPLSAQIIEAAKRRPNLFGLSHNADGRTRRENGSTIVEEITCVRSVDIVTDPASTRSLFESIESDALPSDQTPSTTRLWDFGIAQSELVKLATELSDQYGVAKDEIKQLGTLLRKIQDLFQVAIESAAMDPDEMTSESFAAALHGHRKTDRETSKRIAEQLTGGRCGRHAEYRPL